MHRRAVAALLLLATSVSARETQRLIHRAPPGTWLLARFDFSDEQIAEYTQLKPLLGEFANRAKDCGVDLKHAIHAEVAIANPSYLIIEVEGALNAKKIACVLKVEMQTDGHAEFAGAKISDIQGGVRISMGRPTSGNPSPPVAELEQLSESAPIALVARLGSGAMSYDVHIAGNPTGPMHLQLRFSDASTAKSVHDWLANALVRGSKRGFSALSAVKLSLHERTVEIRVAEMLMGSALALRSEVIEAFKLPSGSMLPTLMVGDHLWVAKGSYAESAKRGDVVVFRNPENGQQFMKRVIAVGGDHLESRSGMLTLNGKKVVPQPAGEFEYEEDHGNGRLEKQKAQRWRETVDGHSYFVLHNADLVDRDTWERKIPEGTVFLMGDSRENSYDSRFMGPIPLSAIEGRVISLWWSSGPSGVRWDRIGRPVQ